MQFKAGAACGGGVGGLVVLGCSKVVHVVAAVVVVVHGGSNYLGVVDSVVELFFSLLCNQKRFSDYEQKSFSLNFQGSDMKL